MRPSLNSELNLNRLASIAFASHGTSTMCIQRRGGWGSGGRPSRRMVLRRCCGRILRCRCPSLLALTQSPAGTQPAWLRSMRCRTTQRSVILITTTRRFSLRVHRVCSCTEPMFPSCPLVTDSPITLCSFAAVASILSSCTPWLGTRSCTGSTDDSLRLTTLGSPFEAPLSCSLSLSLLHPIPQAVELLTALCASSVLWVCFSAGCHRCRPRSCTYGSACVYAL